MSDQSLIEVVRTRQSLRRLVLAERWCPEAAAQLSRLRELSSRSHDEQLSIECDRWAAQLSCLPR